MHGMFIWRMEYSRLQMNGSKSQIKLNYLDIYAPEVLD